MIRFVTALLLGWLALLPATAAPGGVKTQARLVLAESTARPGTTVIAGVELKMPPRVHTYWVNGGDSGMPTEVAWKLPPGAAVAGSKASQPSKSAVTKRIMPDYMPQNCAQCEPGNNRARLRLGNLHVRQTLIGTMN